MNEFLFAPFIKSINMMNLGTDQVVKYLHKYVSIYLVVNMCTFDVIMYAN